MNNKVNLAVEILWIALGIICLTISVKIIIYQENQLLVFLGLSAASFLLAWLRHKMKNRTKEEPRKQ